MLPAAKPSLKSADTWPRPGCASSSTKMLLSANTSWGFILRRIAATRPALSWATIRNLIDSGNPKTMNGMRQNGKIPPAMNTDGQPKFAISGMLIIPPKTAPSAKPHHAVAMSVERLRAGAYSATSAITFGIAPPTPMPQRNRRAVNGATEVAKADAMLRTPNQTTHKARVRMRPNRSARRPNTNDPVMAPRITAANTGPKLAGDYFYFDTML